MTRFAEMRKRLWFLLGALVVYRVGTFIPVPGIDAAAFATFFSTQQGTLLGIFNMFSGGALQRFSILALNVMPYITASIIVQMMSMVVPSWSQIRKEGESGRRKLMQYTRYGTVALAAFQGFGAAVAIQHSGGPWKVIVPVGTALFGQCRRHGDRPLGHGARLRLRAV